VSDNNSVNRPAFFYGNASVSKDTGPDATLYLGVQSVFNSAVQNALFIGAAPRTSSTTTRRRSNRSTTAAPGTGQNGLLPTQFTLSLSLHQQSRPKAGESGAGCIQRPASLFCLAHGSPARPADCFLNRQCFGLLRAAARVLR
jgi:hypothetical protein